MIEVACWKIVWAILGAMLTALSFGNAYESEGNYLVLIVMNFVIATAMLMTPMMVKSIIGSGLQSMSSSLGTAAVAAMAAGPARAATALKTSRGVIGDVGGFAKSSYTSARNYGVTDRSPRTLINEMNNKKQ